MIPTSWKTTLAGVLGIISTIAAGIAAVSGFPPKIISIAAQVAVVCNSIGLLCARDNKVTSEQAGALDHTPKPIEPTKTP